MERARGWDDERDEARKERRRCNLPAEPVIDRLIHEMLGGDRGQDDEIPRLWSAVNAGSTGQLPTFGMADGPQTVTARTPCLAACRLALSLEEYDWWKLPSEP